MNADAMIQEARTHEQHGRLGDAILAYRRVLERWPESPDCWFNLAILERKAGRPSEALSCYQEAIDHGVTAPEEAHLNRGVILADDLRLYPEAESELRTALRLNPSYLPALANLGNLHEDLGRREAAIEMYERIRTLDARNPTALARLANLRRFETPEDPLIVDLRRAIADPCTSAAERAELGFALGRALDECGSYESAFSAYVAANAASRASAEPAPVRYDRAAAERFFQQMIEAFPAPRATMAPQQDSGPAPIFVCGMYRSGSTLTESILARHARVTAGGELDVLPRIAERALLPTPQRIASLHPAQLEALAREYADSLARLFPGAELVTDKRPDNFLYVGLIKTLFPSAKIVHTTRDPLDNCLSIFFLHLDQRFSYALDLMDIGHYYRQYRRLMAHWKRLYGGDVYDVEYDRLVRAPHAAAEALLDFLGLGWQESCLDPRAADSTVKTASVWQVRQPIYASSSGRSRHYARQLQGLRAYLERSD